jgi:hypothetical protein
MNNADVMAIGTGDLGGWVVEFLARAPGMEHKKILVADINEEAGIKRTYSAWSGTSLLGQSPEMEFCKVDLSSQDEIVNLLTRYKPQIICNCTSLQSWWVVDELPKDIWVKLETEAGLGPWVPLHLTLTYELMRAVKQAESKALVVNCSFPDLTNPVLQKVGLAPTCGIGNADLLLPGIRKGVMDKLGVPARSITIYLVAHHSHDVQFDIQSKPGSPYYVKIMVGDKDVTKEFDVDALMVAHQKKQFPGRHGHPTVASSVVKNLWHLLFDTGELSFAPGPNGEIGGYPIRMYAKGVDIVLPEDLTMEEARKINADAQKKDGVERIETDGTIVFTDQAYGLMREIMGYDCKRLKIEETEERAKELLSRYREIRKKYGLA